MRLLALFGSLALFAYIVAALILTFHNFSKLMFGHVFEANPRVRFFMRQLLIMFWPLVLASAEGRRALQVIWTGEWDNDEA